MLSVVSDLSAGAAIVTAGAVRSITNVAVAADASVFLAASVAVTANVWLPSPSPVSSFPEAQFGTAMPSIVHANVMVPATLSVALNRTTGSPLVSVGAESIFVSGGVTSVTSTVAVSTDVRPASSTALTLTL